MGPVPEWPAWVFAAIAGGAAWAVGFGNEGVALSFFGGLVLITLAQWMDKILVLLTDIKNELALLNHTQKVE